MKKVLACLALVVLVLSTLYFGGTKDEVHAETNYALAGYVSDLDITW